MKPEARTRPSARILVPILLLVASRAIAPCQEGGAFGMGAAGLAKLLAGKDASPVLAMDDAALLDTGSYGPAAYYYLGRWIDSRGSGSSSSPDIEARTRLLYRMAFDRAAGSARREAGLSLIAKLSSAGLWQDLLSFSAEYAESVGPEWKAERPRLDAFDALGRNAEAKALVGHLAAAYPAEAAEDGDALAYFGAAADMRSSGAGWARTFRRLLLERPGSDWTARAYAIMAAEPRIRALFSAEELHALSMRDAVSRKDYERAYKEALLGPFAAMGRSSSPAMIADTGKAFLYSGSLKEGEGRFTAVGWTARFYKARFAMALDRLQEAAILFRRAAIDAPTRADADAARWYASDCGYRAALEAAAALSPADAASAAGAADSLLARAGAESAAREAALDDLAAASASWRAAAFADLVNGLFRDALRARDWRLVGDMAERLAAKLEPDASARISYAAARAFELGLGGDAGPSSGPDSRAAAAAVRFAAIADNPSAPLPYRALAAWRAGIEPSFILTDSPPLPSPAGVPDSAGQAETLVAGFATFGLPDIALAEARSHQASLDDEALRRLAALFSWLGRPDCALRLSLDMSARAGFEPRRSDFELLYPRPYLEEIRALRLRPIVPESLAFGLLRSESLFRADVISRAGAVGLSQLMPSTAADQAKAIGLATYDLASPKDNLTIGLSHFASLLGRAEGRPIRAIIAYNAGWGRLATWTDESGDLPDDLMMEALGIQETRQYCRNILQATVMYGELYYGRTVGETVGELVDGEKAK
jgi:soluble lytic murein transglycosylase-like protein